MVNKQRKQSYKTANPEGSQGFGRVRKMGFGVAKKWSIVAEMWFFTCLATIWPQKCEGKRRFPNPSEPSRHPRGRYFLPVKSTLIGQLLPFATLSKYFFASAC